MANWTPDGFAGELFRTFGKYLPPPPGIRSPALWGMEQRIGELFNGHEIVTARRYFDFRYKSAAHWLEISRSYFGPTNRAFAALNTTRQDAPRTEPVELPLGKKRGRGGPLGLRARAVAAWGLPRPVAPEPCRP